MYFYFQQKHSSHSKVLTRINDLNANNAEQSSFTIKAL